MVQGQCSSNRGSDSWPLVLGIRILAWTAQQRQCCVHARFCVLAAARTHPRRSTLWASPPLPPPHTHIPPLCCALYLLPLLSGCGRDAVCCQPLPAVPGQFPC